MSIENEQQSFAEDLLPIDQRGLIEFLAKLLKQDGFESLDLNKKQLKSLNTKELKTKILRAVFTKEGQFNKHHRVEINDNVTDGDKLYRQLLDFLHDSENNPTQILHVRINLGNSINNPMIYIFSKEDLENKLFFDPQEGWVLLCDDADVEGAEERIALEPGHKIDIFSQKPSKKGQLSGFVKRNGETGKEETTENIEVAMGGGLRLQFDSFSQQELDGVGFNCTIETIFNDMGPRGIAGKNNFYRTFPKVIINVRILFNKDTNTFSLKRSQSLKEAESSHSAQQLTDTVLNKLLEQEQNLCLFVQKLFILQPEISTHSIEAVFSYQENDELMIKISDFDGLAEASAFGNTGHFNDGIKTREETINPNDFHTHRTIVNKYFLQCLLLSQFLNSEDFDKSLIIQNSNKMARQLLREAKLNTQLENNLSPIILKTMKKLLKSRAQSNLPVTFEERLASFVDFFHQDKRWEVIYDQTDYLVKKISHANYSITVIEIKGSKLAFMEISNELLDHNNVLSEIEARALCKNFNWAFMKGRLRFTNKTGGD
jgi:hypothetical protein